MAWLRKPEPTNDCKLVEEEKEEEEEEEEEEEGLVLH
jgi:hypothetical protein